MHGRASLQILQIQKQSPASPDAPAEDGPDPASRRCQTDEAGRSSPTRGKTRPKQAPVDNIEGTDAALEARTPLVSQDVAGTVFRRKNARGRTDHPR